MNVLPDNLFRLACFGGEYLGLASVIRVFLLHSSHFQFVENDNRFLLLLLSIHHYESLSMEILRFILSHRSFQFVDVNSLLLLPGGKLNEYLVGGLLLYGVLSLLYYLFEFLFLV